VVTVAMAGMAQAQPAPCGENACTTIVLHAQDEFFPPAGCPAPFDCEATLPAIDNTGFTATNVYVTVRNYEEINGVQAAFNWDLSWNFAASNWSCQESQLSAVTPTGPGPTAGTIGTVFNPIMGGTLEVIGTMTFTAAGAGCLEIIESTFDNGTHTILTGDTVVIAPVIVENRGRICIGPGGVDTCIPIVPVVPTSWGAIKSQYR
jgi:hypothetical protein